MPTSNEYLLKYFKNNGIALIDQDDDYYYSEHIHAFHHVMMLTALKYEASYHATIPTGIRVRKIKED